MSAIITGDASDITSLTATIIGMADNGSGLIRVQTSAPHLFGDQDYVHVVTITTVINSYFIITVIDATHFDLVGSTYTGTGTGTATDASLTPQIQVPTDGDTASLQLSGMLSALRWTLSRTQYLAKKVVQRTFAIAHVTSNSLVVMPPWATHVLMFGCGGGGGGGGGMGGFNGTSGFQFASGGGGGGAKFAIGFTPILGGATSLDIVVGAGGLGGVGSAGAGSPTDAASGLKGNLTSIAYHDGAFSGFGLATFYGGPGGGGGSIEVLASTTTIPVYTPGGGGGPGGYFRNGAASKKTRYAPGPSQVYDLINTAGAISAAGAWATRVYTDPVGQMSYAEGGASMATSGNGTYAAGVSYDGAPGESGFSGGTAGAEGAAGGAYLGGAGGGGGGGGAFGLGANGGAGGTGSAGGGATNGALAGAGAANTGGGGGGGGGGGNGASSAGNGGSGNSGGSGAVYLVFFAAPVTP